MRAPHCVTVLILLLAIVGVAVAQPLGPGATSLREIRATMSWPETLVIRVTGLFQSADDGQVAVVTWAPLEDESVLDRWHVIEGASYQYEVALRSEGEWGLTSLAFAFMAEEPVSATSPYPVPELSLRGSFIATREGRLFPEFTLQGERVRAATVRLLVLATPVQPTVIEVEREATPVTVIYRSDPWDRFWWDDHSYWWRSWSHPRPPHYRPDPGPQPRPERPEREKPRFGTVSPTPPERAPEPPPRRTDDGDRQSDQSQGERESRPAARTQGRPGAR
jgi:hypothetical protein